MKKYSGFKSANMDQFLGYEAGQFDGASRTFDTIANWIEEDLESGSEIDGERYIEVLRRHANDPFVSVQKSLNAVVGTSEPRKG